MQARGVEGRAAGFAAMAVTTVIYGVSYLARDVITQYLHPTVVVALQMVIMAVLFLAYCLATHKSLRISSGDIVLVILSGLLGTAVYNVLTVFSVTFVGANLASLLYGFAAVFSLIIDVVARHRKVTRLSVAGVVVSLVGVAVLMGIDASDLASSGLLGYAFCFAAILSWVVYCFLVDKVSDSYDEAVVLFYQAAAGAVAMIPFIFVYPPMQGAFGNADVVLDLVILGVFNSTLAYFLNIYAIKRIGVTLSNLFLDFMPVVTIVVGMLLNGVVPSANQVIGGVLLMTAVFMLNRDQGRGDAPGA